MAKPHETYTADAVARMTALGLYKKEFMPAINRYADLQEQYDILTARWKRERYRVYVKTVGEAPSKRNPLCVAIEALRKDLTALETILGLTPQGLLKADDAAFAQKKSSPLADVLKGLNAG